jgi:type I restriction enzyme S subunit
MCAVPPLVKRAITAVDCTIVRLDLSKCLPKFLIYISNSTFYFEQIEAYHTGSSRVRISRSNLANIQIPLPPLEVQEQIVAEIESEKSQIDSAKKLIETYEARIKAVIAKLWSE